MKDLEVTVRPINESDLPAIRKLFYRSYGENYPYKEFYSDEWLKRSIYQDSYLSLLAEAVNHRLPVLGVCRGQQLINVFFGGTLHRDLSTFYVEDPEVRTILPRMVVLVEAGARLARCLGCGPERVNALHRHAIDRLGDGLRVAARDRNGIVQAIEHATLPLLLGVQWHPEYLPQIPAQRAIFQALVNEACRAGVDTASKA